MSDNQRPVDAPRHTPEPGHHLAEVVEQAPDGVLITNKDGVIEYVNPSFEALSGYGRDELVGRTPRLLRSGVHDASFYEQLWRVLQSGRTVRAIFTDRTRTGELVHLEQTIAPLTNTDGEVTHYVADARDVSARVRADAALRHVNEALERQAKCIAERLHDEAGQILTAVYIALAGAAACAPAAAPALEAVRGHLDRLEEQLRQLAHELRPRILEDLGLVPAIEFLADGVVKRWGIEVAVEARVQRRLPIIVETTLYRLAQEGLTNVAKHARAQHVVIRVEEAPQAVRCSIEDDGIGFDRAPASPFGEQGLGLATIRERVEALGGTFSIDSGPGKRTSLECTIPLEV
jgi:PAS domain S-box-containing protein